MLQFISHYNDRYDYIRGVREVLRGGCRWVQLRMKDADDDSFMAVGRSVGAMCREAGAVFVLDDRVHLVEALGADGVHLGKNDMPVAEARAILGRGKIIGATANTLDDMLAAVAAGADYIGLGPFRFTTTKARLSPVLGVEGYLRLMSAFREKSSIPVVAIGGITAADVPALMDAGVSGIAMSGALLGAEDAAAATDAIVNLISKYTYKK
ncbi:MAG: thiamine phosphate synthase [Muribaculaceae bacterium]|nr:thiamine phosphate synthase [Muribaculaceae bacterium]